MAVRWFRSFWKKTVWPLFDSAYAAKIRKRLKNDSFTLITQNCIGGLLYSFFGRRFDSPTVNTYILQKDFCRFCSDLPYYMASDLRFYADSSVSCPCAYLGEGSRRISVQFTHYRTEKEALEKWISRRQRIHWDNLYIITSDGNGVSAGELNVLSNAGAKGVVVFTSRPKPEIANSFQLKSLGRYETAERMQLERSSVTGLRPWQKEFDVAAWLNGSSPEQFRI